MVQNEAISHHLTSMSHRVKRIHVIVFLDGMVLGLIHWLIACFGQQDMETASQFWIGPPMSWQDERYFSTLLHYPFRLHGWKSHMKVETRAVDAKLCSSREIKPLNHLVLAATNRKMSYSMLNLFANCWSYSPFFGVGTESNLFPKRMPLPQAAAGGRRSSVSWSQCGF